MATIENLGIDIVDGNLSLKLVTGKDSITDKFWSTQDNFQEGDRENTDTYTNPGKVKLLSLDDNFEKTVINEDRWRIYDDYSDSIIKIENGMLQISIQSTDVTNKQANVIGKFAIKNENVSFEIDWGGLDFNLTGDGDVGPELFMGVDGASLVYIKRIVDNGTHYYQRNVHINESYFNYQRIPTTDISGKFRITRAGGKVHTYYYSNNEWLELGIATSFPNSPARPNLKIWKGAAGGASAWFDNFKVITPDNTYLKRGTWTANYDSGIEGFDWGVLSWTGDWGCLSEGACATDTLFSGSLQMGDGSGDLTDLPLEYHTTFFLDHTPVENMRLLIDVTSVSSNDGASIFINGQKLGNLEHVVEYNSNYFYITPDLLLEGENTISIILSWVEAMDEYDDIWINNISILEGTQIRFRTKSADNETNLSAAVWSDYILTPGSTIASPDNRFIEIQAELETSNLEMSPYIDSISIESNNENILWETSTIINQPNGIVDNPSNQTSTLNTLGIFYLNARLINKNGELINATTYPLTVSQGDIDGDGIPDELDNSPDIPNPDQADTDGDGIGDISDAYPNDQDNDGFEGVSDNCPEMFNPDQTDTDGDSLGDACDPDDDNDGLTDNQELALGTDSLLADSDGDGYTDGEEITLGTDPLVQNEKAALMISTDKGYFSPGESAT
ncbi:MAG: hypothetical protein GY699_10400, partial [Desulfobacteraceae bacterium]|nr:hypothetical protein [Desulfobacteraceae bacterium]